MVKRLLILFLFSIVTNVFAEEYQPFAPASNAYPSTESVVSGSGLGYQPFSQNTPFSSGGFRLKSAASCPMCDGNVVGGICQDCGHVLGTSLGTDVVPVADGWWVLLSAVCVYFYFKRKRQKTNEKKKHIIKERI